MILRIADQTQEAIHDGLPKSPPELARRYDLAPRVDGMNLKDHFRQIETNARDSGEIPDRLAHGRLPFRWSFDNDHLGTLMPFEAPSTPSP